MILEWISDLNHVSRSHLRSSTKSVVVGLITAPPVSCLMNSGLNLFDALRTRIPMRCHDVWDCGAVSLVSRLWRGYSRGMGAGVLIVVCKAPLSDGQKRGL